MIYRKFCIKEIGIKRGIEMDVIKENWDLIKETLDVVWILEEARNSAGIIFERQ